LPVQRSNLGPPCWMRRPQTVRRTRALPGSAGTCGWFATLPPPPPAQRLAGEARVDCAVVGAGFTGLAAARQIAIGAPELSVAVVDAQRAGEGASGRSSGFVVDLAHFIARLGFAASKRYVALSRMGIAALREAVAAHGIDCAWDDRGWIHAAAGEAAAGELPRLAEWLDRLGERYEWLDGGGLAAATGTDFYRRGLRLPGSVLVQPAALSRGLAASLPARAALHEESPVQSIRRRREGGWLLTMEHGRLVAERLFVAANGYTGALRVLADRVLPLTTFGSLTRPLDRFEQRRLGGDREWGLLAEDPMGSTLRRTRDQRLLVRNTLRYDPAFDLTARALAGARESHRRALAARFPALAGIAIDHTWGGVMGTSPNRGHAFGEVEPGLFAAAGYTGAGIAMGTAAGTLLADLALGVSSPPLDDMLALPAPAWLPPRPFLDWGTRLRVARMNRSAGPAI
jgi:glycine/D-amino acid oxidase-like deaminating enzyme